MAVTTTATTTTTAISSGFHKTVSLHDWWLIYSQTDFNGKTLAIEGVTSTGTRAMRIFTSAPIAKRFDFCTLETADRITVLIKGYINGTRTNENGISSQVCDNFLIGFPFNWEEFSYRCGEGSRSTNIISQLSECGNREDVEYKGNSCKEKSEDAAVLAVPQMNGVSGPTDIELHEIDNSMEKSRPSTRRSERLKKVKGSDNRQESERKKATSVSVDSDLVRNAGNDEGSGSGGKLVLREVIRMNLEDISKGLVMQSIGEEEILKSLGYLRDKPRGVGNK